MKQAPITFSDAGIFASGIGQVVITRHKGGGKVELGVFLVDPFCHGVKNAFFTPCDGAELEGILQRLFKGGQAVKKLLGYIILDWKIEPQINRIDADSQRVVWKSRLTY